MENDCCSSMKPFLLLCIITAFSAVKKPNLSKKKVLHTFEAEMPKSTFCQTSKFLMNFMSLRDPSEHLYHKTEDANVHKKKKGFGAQIHDTHDMQQTSPLRLCTEDMTARKAEREKERRGWVILMQWMLKIILKQVSRKRTETPADSEEKKHQRFGKKEVRSFNHFLLFPIIN